MAKWAFLFCGFLSVCGAAMAQHDTLDVPFRQAGLQSGDTSFLYMNRPPQSTSTGSYLERFFNKNIRAFYRGDTAMVTGTVFAWFVIDEQGKCTSGYCDTAGGQQGNARNILWAINKLNAAQPITPTRIKGRPVVSRVKMRIVFQFAADAEPPAPPVPKPDILVIGYPAMH